MTKTRAELARENALRWTQLPFDDATRAEVQALFDNKDDETILNRFGDSLHFGTAGLRGVMGAGSTMMNRYTVAKASKAIAQCLREDYAQQNACERGVVLGYDCRHNSELFAKITAEVLAANGVKVYLYDRITPTPLVPFAVKAKGAIAGIMITSSHNPKVYNGYKVFWDNGAQIVAPIDSQIASRMDKLQEGAIESLELEEAKRSGKVVLLGEQSIAEYVDWVVKSSVLSKHSDVKIVYTPLGGTGWETASASFKQAGFKDVHVVAEERDPDPEFAGLDAPNPERLDTWPRALALAKAKKADIVLANDGDADRIGVAIPVDGEYKILGGNQIGALMLYYILEQLPKSLRNEKSFAICSVVSSPLTRAICEGFGVSFQETLTGFKWMGNVADERVAKGENFLFAYEEAFGYTFSSARDKDGIISILLLAELAAYCKAKGQSMGDVLDEIYQRFGIHIEDAAERFYEGFSGQETMKGVLANLRSNPPKSIAGIEVVRVRDLLQSQNIDMKSGAKEAVTHLPKQDMLSFYLADDSWISLRPSGTEPKLKSYLGVIARDASADYVAKTRALEDRIAKIKDAVVKML
ncbi:MAG: phospho-sugar mutase [Bradymonadales bacterium]|jgi:phosphoglucomutase